MNDSKNFTYRNITEQTLTVIGVGVVKGGDTITVKEPFSNPNFELVEDSKNVTKAEQPKVAGKDKE